MIALARRTYPRTLRFLPYRDELPLALNARGLRGKGVEVGVAEGEFSEHILTLWHGRQLISVDPWLEMSLEEYVDSCNVPQGQMDASYELTTRRLARFGDRSEVWRLRGDEAAQRFGQRELDFVYVDALHSYEAVRQDLETWYPLVRRGGIIAGHDYNDGLFAQGLHGVKSAVDAFFTERSLRVCHTWIDVPCTSWIVEKA